MRDFQDGGGQYRELLESKEDILSKDIKVTVTEPGYGEPIPKGASIRTHYVGKLLNGKIFDSSYEKKQAFKFQQGQGEVIRGLDESLLGLRKGAHALIYCPPEYGYGDQEV